MPILFILLDFYLPCLGYNFYKKVLSDKQRLKGFSANGQRSYSWNTQQFGGGVKKVVCSLFPDDPATDN